MPQAKQKNSNPLATLEAKIHNALTNYETHSKYKTEAESELENLLKAIEDKKAEILNLTETIDLNLRMAESIKAKKLRIVEASEILKELGNEAAIAIELAGLQPTDPEPEQQSQTSTEQTLDEMVAEAKATPEPEPQPAPIAAPPIAAQAQTASEQIAEIDPKPTEIPVTTEVDGYKISFTRKCQAFEFVTPQKEYFTGIINQSCTPKIVGMKQGSDSKTLICYTSGAFPTEWDKHLQPLESAIREVFKKNDINIKYPERKQPELTVDLPTQKLKDLGTITLKGYKITYVDAQDFKKKDTTKTGLKFSLHGKGCTKNGCEIFYNFSKNNSLYELGIKKGDNYYSDAHQLQQSKELEALRQVAIEFLAAQLPEYKAAWEDEMEYYSDAKQPAGPAAAAADNPVK